MSGMGIQDMSYKGIQIGAGMTLIPVAATTLIACSKFIFINIIANTVLGLFTSNWRISVQSNFVAVPILWKASLISAIIGISLIVLSLTVAFGEGVYRQRQRKI